jgi:hypothetical protein
MTFASEALAFWDWSVHYVTCTEGSQACLSLIDFLVIVINSGPLMTSRTEYAICGLPNALFHHNLKIIFRFTLYGVIQYSAFKRSVVCSSSNKLIDVSAIQYSYQLPMYDIAQYCALCGMTFVLFWLIICDSCSDIPWVEWASFQHKKGAWYALQVTSW